MPKRVDVHSLQIINIGLSSRVFDVRFEGTVAGGDEVISFDFFDNHESDGLNIVRHILSDVAAAYGKAEPVTFPLTIDDDDKIVLPPVTQARTVPPVTQARTLGVKLININTADATELEKLPWVGPKLAKRIIDKQPFKTVDELENVPGIGPAMIQVMKLLITV